ncbi:hypothetical protein [Paraclostridium bifermentans]|uniref:hypothetical protein n=1 Tax=Paraclostridium bifermentans TaxID=1490 RepID=UPI00387ACB83
MSKSNNLKQINSEIKCFERKLENLREAVELKDISQIEIEFSNVISNFEEVKNELEYVNEDKSTNMKIGILLISCC